MRNSGGSWGKGWPVLAATGLRAEAWIAARSHGVGTVAGGGNADHLDAALEHAIANGARAIISFGIAGGLKPGLKPGHCVAGRCIIAGSERYAADAAWTARLMALLRPHGAELGDLAGVDQPVVSARDKADLFADTGAHAADMESHIAARAARRHGLPFAALRIIIDPAERTLPHAALNGMRPDGGTNVTAVLGSLARNPWQLSALLAIGRDAATAMRALKVHQNRSGPGLGFLPA